MKELITGRTWELTWAAEKLLEFKEEMEHLQCSLGELATLVSKEKAGELIIAACGVEVHKLTFLYWRLDFFRWHA